MKRLLLLIAILTLSAGTAAASWMGETWLWSRVEKVYPHNDVSSYRKVSIRILKWAMGAGHGDWYGKKFPGRLFTVKLKCKNPSVAALMKKGDTFWVKHHASDSFGVDSKGKHRAYSSRTWKHLGNNLWVYKPLIVKNLVSGVKLPSSPPAKVLWGMRHSNNVTLKVRYSTLGKYYVKFRILNIKETKNSVTLALVYKPWTTPGYDNYSRKQINRIIQFSAAAFDNKTVNIVINGKTVINLKK